MAAGLGNPAKQTGSAALPVHSLSAYSERNGAKRARTADPLHAMQVLYQLSYSPVQRNL